MTTEAELAGSAAARSPDSAEEERPRLPVEVFPAVVPADRPARPAFPGED